MYKPNLNSDYSIKARIRYVYSKSVHWLLSNNGYSKYFDFIEDFNSMVAEDCYVLPIEDCEINTNRGCSLFNELNLSDSYEVILERINNM